jgi:hypothetical protein
MTLLLQWIRRCVSVCVGCIWGGAPLSPNAANFDVRLILVILFCFPLTRARAGDTPTSPDFSSYPQDYEFRLFLSAQTNGAWHLGRGNLLAIAEFPTGVDSARESYVTESGKEYHRIVDFGFAVKASGSKQLSEADLRTLRSAIRDLPATNASPPIARLIIVSFHQGTNWITRTYDSGRLPQAMRQIQGAIGERWVRSFTVQ